MPVHNADIAAIFDEIADLLEIQGANPFRVRAYRNAARMTGELGRDLAAMVQAGADLEALPGIGEDLAAKIREIVTTGRCSFLDRLRHELPPAVTELLKIPGLGPKRVRKLHDALGVNSLPELAAAAASGRIAGLEGFGPKTEEHIRAALATHIDTERRFLRAVAAQYAEPFARYLRDAPGVHEVVIAGSYRRLRETVGDIDILATAAQGADVVSHFTRYDEVRTVLSAGDTRATVVLACGLQVDLRVVPPESFGAALHYFTGSKAHNIAVRKLAQTRGLKLNEYGVFRGSKRVGGDIEASVFEAVGLAWIPPELREDRGEIDAARARTLPKLIEMGDLKGDLHAHTKASDGRHSLREMAQAARTLGLQYLAITDHSQRLTVAHGLDPARLARQHREIARLNEELDGIRLLHGVEVDILEDGSLDLPEEALANLDLVVAALHSKLDMPQAAQDRTRREGACQPARGHPRASVGTPDRRASGRCAGHGCRHPRRTHGRGRPRDRRAAAAAGPGRRPLPPGTRRRSPADSVVRRAPHVRPRVSAPGHRSGPARLARGGRCAEHPAPGGSPGVARCAPPDWQAAPPPRLICVNDRTAQAS